MDDELYMRQALALACLAEGDTSPNPMVGAVIVSADGEVVGEGYHHKAGQPHAEINALKEAKKLARGGTIYVTLEPCSHFGRTGPCCEAIIAAGLKRVVAAVEDPNPKVAGNGFKRLRDAGIEVTVGVCAEEARLLNEKFFHWIVTGRPFVSMKYAMTLDGKIATRTGDSKWITGEDARAYGHYLRKAHDCILVGKNTVLADDPELTTRLVEGRTGLIMELPPYHKPHWKSLFGSVFSKMGNVLSRALRIIICISVIFWLLSYSADGNVANSIIYKVGTFIEPVTSLFGLPWQLFIAFVASAMGKEASLGVMASLFNTGSIWAAIEQSATVDTAALSTSMLSVISRPEALAFLFAFFFNMPCLMALTATTQETHSMKWTVRIALYYVLTALIMATIAYHVGLVIF